MEKVAGHYLSLIRDISPPKLPVSSTRFYSSVTGQLGLWKDLTNMEYWVQNLVFPVRFSELLSAICCSIKAKAKKLGAPKAVIQVGHVLEIEPHAAFQEPIKDIFTLDEKSAGYLSILKRGTSTVTTSLDVADLLHCLGFFVDISGINNHVAIASPSLLTSIPAF